jgi:hypothetical protein
LCGRKAPPETPAVPPPLWKTRESPCGLPFQCIDDDIHFGGLSCTEEQPCPIYLELSAIESVGNQLFTAGNIHSDSATLYSIFLASADNGKTWREPFERVRGATFDRIRFIDFQHGWVTGEIVQPLDRDPFLLITGDGAKAWRKQPVFEDGRAGSIQQIWFDTPNTGSLVFDRGQSGDGPRYELYESATAGDNWMVREASDKPIRIKRMPAETTNPDWRVQPDVASKSNRLEKRQGTRWTPVASFAIEIGSCKPAPLKEQPPPPETTDQPAVDPNAKGVISLQELRGEPPKRPAKK